MTHNILKGTDYYIRFASSSLGGVSSSLSSNSLSKAFNNAEWLYASTHPQVKVNWGGTIKLKGGRSEPLPVPVTTSLYVFTDGPFKLNLDKNGDGLPFYIRHLSRAITVDLNGQGILTASVHLRQTDVLGNVLSDEEFGSYVCSGSVFKYYEITGSFVHNGVTSSMLYNPKHGLRQKTTVPTRLSGSSTVNGSNSIPLCYLDTYMYVPEVPLSASMFEVAACYAREVSVSGSL